MGEEISEPDQKLRKRRRRGLIPPELVDLVMPAVKAGGYTGGAGAVIGLATGIVREQAPAVYSLAVGLQYFALGSGYWASRTAIIRLWGEDRNRISNGHSILASSMAGGAVGFIRGMIRGPANVLPGTLAFALYCAGGQFLVNAWHSRKEQLSPERMPGDEKTASAFWSRWRPMKRLSDEEYIALMKERILVVDAEIELIEEEIAKMEREERARQGGRRRR